MSAGAPGLLQPWHSRSGDAIAMATLSTPSIAQRQGENLVITTQIDRISPRGRFSSENEWSSPAWLGAALRRLKLFPALPDRPAPSNRESDAASVRALADTYRQTDPGFAADLYAAADRHEWSGND